MRLDPTELCDLANFLARRDLPGAVGLVQWERRLEQAQRDGELAGLLQGLAAQRPGDQNLARMTEMLAHQSTPGGASAMVGVTLVGGGFVGAVSLIALGILAVGLTTMERTVAADAPVLVAAVEPPEFAGGVAATPDRRRLREGRCTNSHRDIVGFWYAGAAHPGAPGDVVTLERSMNVRVDYPDRHNDFDARARIACVLHPGDQVTLSAEPIRVPPNRYWVPLRTGDLVPAPDQQTARLR
jgi:hypothetical protein